MLTAASRLADELLFPQAIATDRSPLLARELLDALADAGLYAMAGPPELSGGDLPPDGHLDVIEVLAGGCLTTTLVWLQHHSAVGALVGDVSARLRERWLAPLCRGDVRAGAAFSGLRGRDGPAVTAVETSGGWLLHGTAPWVSGWGRIDVARTAACDADGTIVWALMDAVEGPSLEVTPLPLVAMGATGTVAVSFRGHFVSADRVLSRQPLADWIANDGAEPMVRVHAALATGVAAGGCSLLGRTEYDDELVASRRELATAGAAGDRPRLLAARAWALDLAVRTSYALVAASGGRALLLDQHAQRLAREAMFLLVFAQTPEMREAQFRLAATISRERLAENTAMAAH